jgi:GT2 family glycosyltransferase
LLHAVAALHDQTVPLAGIIVVDTASQDSSAARVVERFPAVTLLRLEANVGPAAARNAGLRLATTDLVLLVDHDIYLERDCVSHLLGAQRQWSAVAACPRIHLHPEREIVQADGAELHFVGTLALRNGFQRLSDTLSPDTVPVGAVPGGCLLVQRGPMLQAGGFDELIFFFFEDLELSVRLRALGHTLVAVPHAQAYHDRGTGSPTLAFRGQGTYPPERLHLTLRHRLLTILVHYRLRTLIVLAPALLLYELASLVLAVRLALAGEWARAWTWQVANSSAILERRRRAQRTRVRNDREILSGGPLPLAPGVVRGRGTRAMVRLLSSVLNAYWRVTRAWVG